MMEAIQESILPYARDDEKHVKVVITKRPSHKAIRKEQGYDN
jgi:hypothetical protein